MGEEVIRLRATRAGNRSVVTKLVSEVEQISHVELNAKARDRLKRIAFMLDQKAQLLSGLNEQNNFGPMSGRRNRERHRGCRRSYDANYGYQSRNVDDDYAFFDDYGAGHRLLPRLWRQRRQRLRPAME